VVAFASSPTELMIVLAQHPCDVLITDFSMPDSAAPDGFSMLERVRRLHPEMAIILLSAVTNVAILRATAGLGVLGLMDKSSDLSELAQAIRTVRRGLPYVSASHQRRAASAGHAHIRPVRPQGLSVREAEVLRLLGIGLTVSQIAQRTQRGITTISRQKRDAMRKLGIAGDAELFDYLRGAM